MRALAVKGEKIKAMYASAAQYHGGSGLLRYGLYVAVPTLEDVELLVAAVWAVSRASVAGDSLTQRLYRMLPNITCCPGLSRIPTTSSLYLINIGNEGRA